MATEKQIGQLAKSRLYQHTAAMIHSRLTKRSGAALNELEVIPRYNKQQLTRIAIKAPKHVFIQNYGFEGVKSNGINMRLKSTNVINDAIERSAVVGYLADALSEVRADEILIQFRG